MLFTYCTWNGICIIKNYNIGKGELEQSLYTLKTWCRINFKILKGVIKEKYIVKYWGAEGFCAILSISHDRQSKQE